MADQTTPQEEDLGKVWVWLNHGVVCALLAASVAAAVGMAALLFVGFIDIFQGVKEGVKAGLAAVDVAHAPPWSERTAHRVIEGVELLLLAPLAYIVLVNLARYVHTWMIRKSDEKAKASLLGVKALVVGLLIAMIATDLVGKVLSDNGLDPTSAIFESLVIGVLIIYCFELEWVAARILRSGTTAEDKEAAKEPRAAGGSH